MGAAKKKILITGTGGFIGGNLVRQAFHTKQNYSIVSIDRIRDSNSAWNVYVNSDHKFYIADIRDAHILNMIFQVERPDVVVHLAAESHVDSSIKDAHPFITSNILGTQNIIDACLKHDVSRLVYTSTDEVMGHLEDENAESWTEESPLNPRSPYSASKASGELLIKAAHKTHGLSYNITRACNCYGPWQHPEKFIPKIIKSVLNEEEMPVYGQGLQIRDWMHVSDKCSAIFTIINNGKENEVYNISAGQEFSNIEVFQIICNTLGRGHSLIKFVADRPGHDFRYSINSQKLKDIGWSAEYKFRDGIIDTCQWYVNNKFFFKQMLGE